MGINRKDFIKTSSLLAAGTLFGFHKSLLAKLQDSGLKNITENIGIFIGQGGTIGWFVSGNSSVVIDTQFPDSAKNFMENFKEKSSKINLLFNTHHHRDHTAGNIFLKDYADKIVAHERCPMLQEKQNKGTENENQQAYADTTFASEWTQELENEKVIAKYFGPAHTGGDIVIHFEKENIAHVGDLVFNKTNPFIDQNGGGSIESWIKVLEKVEAHYPDDTTFIFGHASDNVSVTGKKNDVKNMRNYLSALLDYVSKEIEAGKSLDEIKSVTSLKGFEHIKERRAGALAGNLEAAFNELKK